MGDTIEVLLARGRREDGFFIHTFDADARPEDLRADLYDHAFLLFGLAHAAQALAYPELMEVAGEVMDLLERHWRHPAGGFREGEIEGPPRRQNPHMHMFEAGCELWRASGAPRWQMMTDEILQLCLSSFIDSQSGALTEYFSDDWSRLPGAVGQVVEPGHCLEWAWLLNTSHSREAHAAAASLIAFATAYGLDATRGVAINEVGLNGRIIDPSARLWPQTERLKAALAALRRTGDPSFCDEAVNAFCGLEKYLQTAVPGLWYDCLLPNGNWADGSVPASSFYHIVCGLSELLHSADLIESTQLPNFGSPENAVFRFRS